MAVISLDSINWLVFEMQLQSAFCEVGFHCLYFCYITVTLLRAETGPSCRFCWYNDDDNFDDLLQFARQAWMADTLFLLLLLLLMMMMVMMIIYYMKTNIKNNVDFLCVSKEISLQTNLNKHRWMNISQNEK